MTTQTLMILIVISMFVFISFEGFRFFIEVTTFEAKDKYLGIIAFGISSVISLKYLIMVIYPIAMEMLKI